MRTWQFLLGMIWGLLCSKMASPFAKAGIGDNFCSLPLWKKTEKDKGKKDSTPRAARLEQVGVHQLLEVANAQQLAPVPAAHQEVPVLYALLTSAIQHQLLCIPWVGHGQCPNTKIRSAHSYMR